MATDPSTDAPRSPFAMRPTGRRIVRKLGFGTGGVLGAAQLSMMGIAVTWLPLFVLSLIEGSAFGANVAISFLHDYVPHGRYLIALPLLLFLGPLFERRTASAIRHLNAAGLVRATDQERLQDVVASVARASRSKIVLGAFVAVTYIVAVGSYLAVRELDVSHWMLIGSDATARPSMAGTWSLLVSTPLVRLLYLHAFWKMAVWIWFLVRLSRLSLDINAFHADGRCGLRFLGETQLAFIPLIAALGIQLGCMVALSVRLQATSLATHKLTGIAFVVLSMLVLVGPLCVFARRAWLERERAEDGFSVWSSLAARHMSAQLSASRHDYPPSQLTSSEISSMTDASALFDRVLATRPIPIDTRQLALILVAAIVPTLLPLLTLLPLAEIWRRLAAILL